VRPDKKVMLGDAALGKATPFSVIPTDLIRKYLLSNSHSYLRNLLTGASCDKGRTLNGLPTGEVGAKENAGQGRAELGEIGTIEALQVPRLNDIKNMLFLVTRLRFVPGEVLAQCGIAISESLIEAYRVGERNKSSQWYPVERGCVTPFLRLRRSVGHLIAVGIRNGTTDECRTVRLAAEMEY
jgi:hypothetical protein